MTSVLESLPVEMRSLFESIVGLRAPELFAAISNCSSPTQVERVAVLDILSREFTCNLGPAYEPNQYGKDVDELLGQFLLQWPIRYEC